MSRTSQSSSKSSSVSPNMKVASKYSKTSQGAPEKSADVGKLKPEGLDIYHSSSQYDCCSYIVHCATHDKVLLATALQEPLARWMPFTPMSPTRSWKDGALVGFCMMLAGSNKKRFEALKSAPPFESFKCLKVLRLQQPQTQKFVTRSIYYFKLKSANSDTFACCQPIASAPHLEWFPMEAVCSGQVPNLWSPELVHYCQLVPKSSDTGSPEKPPIIGEFSLEEAFLYVPRDPPRNCEEEVLKSLKITQAVVERVFADWMDLLFPGFYLSVDSFKYYMTKFKFETDASRLERLFAAFSFDKTGYLSFHEFLLGLACLEQNCIHGEFRTKFIFRYFNTDGSGQMAREQLQVLVAATCQPTEVQTKLREAIADIGGTTNQTGPWTEKEFLCAVGSRRFRGTSQLCRSKRAIFSQILRSIAMKSLNQSGCKKVLGNVIIKRKQPNEVCSTCTEKKYELASHLVHFYTDSRMVSSALENLAPRPEPKKSSCLTARQYSAEFVFKCHSVPNAAIKIVREFSSAKGTAQRPNGLMSDRREDLWKLLLLLHDDIEMLLDLELKCQKVYSPCYIIGDVHGNLEDLLSMERALWSNMPCLGANYLFLGDYVDRGQWSFECSVYLLAFKVLCPNKITLLRGNHEVRSLQTRYSYKRECIIKYGELFGLKIWELSNRMFDKLPVCALVDDAIFCAHGGIPHAAKTLQQIAAVNRKIREPEEESDIVWEILWSDPANMAEFLDTCEVCEIEPEATGGFVFNTKRGTAFKFNEEGATRFLKANMLTHIIRAHEVAMLGYEFNFGAKCVTIFSSSHYCGNDNDCGLILADNQRLRVVHVDTTNNQPATD